MSETDLTEAEISSKLEDIASGYQKTQVLYVAAKLGLVELLSAAPQGSAALAAATGANAEGLYRLLRALSYMEIVHEPTPGLFALTPLGERLRPGAPGALHELILMSGEVFWSWWNGLAHTVRTGLPSVPMIEGMTAFEYLHRQPDQARRFDRIMSEMVGTMAKGVVEVYDFRPFHTVVDVGGGRGTLLATILLANPHLRGVLFDLPVTVEEARRTLVDHGLADRCECVSGDFFAKVPSGDCLVLSAVLSDWNDEQCVAILRNCRQAIAADGRLLVLERLLEPEKPAPASAFLDIQMMVFSGGTGRSSAEYRRLFAAAGFELARVIQPGPVRHIFEGRPV